MAPVSPIARSAMDTDYAAPDSVGRYCMERIQLLFYQWLSTSRPQPGRYLRYRA